MSTDDVPSNDATSVARVDTKLEIVVIPVSDVDRAKEFYGRLGWRLDADYDNGDDFRVIQFTPPGSGCCGGDILAEDDRASGARRRELDHAEVVTVVIVGVEPPPEPPVELLRAVDIRDGDDDHLEFRLDSCDAGRVVTTEFVRAYGCLPGCVG